jgi:hypothetical protein
MEGSKMTNSITAKQKVRNSVVSDLGLEGGADMDTIASGKHAAALFRRIRTNGTKMVQVWVEAGTILIAAKAEFGGTNKGFQSWLRQTGLNKVGQQDRSDAEFMAAHKAEVEKLIAEGKVRIGTTSPSSFRKLIKQQPKAEKAATSEAGSVSEAEADANTVTVAEGKVQVSNETRAKLEAQANKVRLALAKSGLSEAEIRLVGQLLAE